MTDEAVEGDAPQKFTGVVRPVQGLGTAVVALLGLNIVGNLADIWGNVIQLQLLESMNLGEFVSDAMLEANDARQLLLALLSFVVFLLTAIVFMAWMKRAYSNLSGFGYAPMHTSGWAIGSWIVPILDLYRPFQMMREIHVVSDPAREFGDYVEQKASPAIVAWWTIWIVGNGLDRASMRLDGDTIPELTDFTTTMIGSDIVTIMTALLAIVVVRSATKRQTETMQRVGADPATF